MKLPIDEIEVGSRYRQDMGDLEALKASIADVGLIQPIVVTPNKKLISGGRRLAAVRGLGWVRVDVHIMHGMDDAATVVRTERDENTCREEMRVSELVAIGKRLEELERPKAQARRAANLPNGSMEPFGEPEPHRRMAEAIGEAIGMSRASYERARLVVDAASDPDPVVAETAKEAIKHMDETGKVRPAWEKVQAVRYPPEEKPKAPPKHGPRKKHLAIIQSISTALSGLATAADEITELDSTITREEATRLRGDLSQSIASLRRLNSLLNKEIIK